LTALDPIASLKIGLAFGIAFPLAPFITTRILKMGGEGWAIQEEVRGGLIGLLLFLTWAATLAAGTALKVL
jgi:flagellar biosynthesis protein FliR